MAHHPIHVMLVQKKTKNQNNSITGSKAKEGNFISHTNTLHSTTLEKLKVFKFIKQGTPHNITKEDLHNHKVQKETQNTGNAPKTCSNTSRVTLSVICKKVVTLKPPKRSFLKLKQIRNLRR